MKEENLKKGYNGYKLTENGRATLLRNIIIMFPNVVAHHVTHQFGIYDKLPPDALMVEVIAVAYNDKVQAAVVKVNGTTTRPDGKTYHVTVSIDKAKGGKPVDSNEVVSNVANWQEIKPFYIEVLPSFFPFNR